MLRIAKHICLIALISSRILHAATPIALEPEFAGPDLSLPQIHIKLISVARDVQFPTDIQFMPETNGRMVVLEKNGVIKFTTLQNNEVASQYTEILKIEVNQDSEMGLLGLAFHPDFKNNHAIFINYNPKDQKLMTRISKFTLDSENKASNEQIILTVDQPYGNHKAGQLAFGPADKMLYIGLGDGGSGGDPQGNAQNMQSLLGKMLRINVDRPSKGKLYSIPSDNPFAHYNKALPEIWAIGLRNPWRYSFDNLDRLIVADVGQDKFEEVDIVRSGFNLGWNVKEASHCFKANRKCVNKEYIDPVYEYGRNVGSSITGGYVYNGNFQRLNNKYIFGDFVTGRLYALDLPDPYIPNQSEAKAYTLGGFKINPSSFGRDANGNVYVADFGTGIIYKIVSRY